MGETVYLSLGSNRGDRAFYLQQATEQLSQKAGMSLVAASSIYVSKPIGCAPECAQFLNQVLKFNCTLQPTQLLDQTERLERRLGRTVKGNNADRIIDIDIILFGDRVVKNTRLEIPHPRLTDRAFVLLPLHEIAPDAKDPRTEALLTELLARVGDQPVTPYGGISRDE
jgi:2-amino-4-hydroxy-6-hydroxymethyldihydropteridine diphosphokinase